MKRLKKLIHWLKTRPPLVSQRIVVDEEGVIHSQWEILVVKNVKITIREFSVKHVKY